MGSALSLGWFSRAAETTSEDVAEDGAPAVPVEEAGDGDEAGAETVTEPVFVDPRPFFSKASACVFLEETHVDVAPPTTYGALPSTVVTSLQEVGVNARWLTRAEVCRYWTDLAAENGRVKCLNRLVMSQCFYECDYCRTWLRREATLRSLPLFLCVQCGRTMCAACQTKTNQKQKEEDRLSSTAVSTDEKQEGVAPSSTGRRQRATIDPQQCAAHRLVPVDPEGEEKADPVHDCVLCCAVIRDAAWFEAIREDGATVRACAKCVSAPSRVPDCSGLHFRPVRRPTHYCDGSGFGSMLDWLPLARELRTDQWALVLYNANVDAPCFRRLAVLHSDDHGRAGYFDIGEDFFALQPHSSVPAGPPSPTTIEQFLERTHRPTYYG